MIRVKDLKDQILTTDKGLLYCDCCGSECSANKGDYWNCRDNEELICSCGNPFKKVIKETNYKEVK